LMLPFVETVVVPAVAEAASPTPTPTPISE
jgi:hypothetical protein